MKKIIDEVKHLWTYHIVKIMIAAAIIAILLITTQ
jgi:hypothetical protein